MNERTLEEKKRRRRNDKCDRLAEMKKSEGKMESNRKSIVITKKLKE